MNILQILPELNVGGVETGTVDVARHLVKLGHKSVVVSNGGALVKDLASAGVIHYQLPVHRKSLVTMLKAVKSLVEIIKKEKIDIVHARSRVPAWIAYAACRRTGVVFITTCHGYYTRHPFSLVMGWAKQVIVLSNIIGRHMIDDFKVPYERIRLIPRSVDIERFTYISPETKRGKQFNVGIIGRITPLKGHGHFIKAMAKAARVIPDLKIWIVGDAPSSKQTYKDEIHLLVKRLGLEHCTQFLGVQRDIPAILSQLDLLVLATTTQEAFGRVIIEAQAAGVPVIATKVGGVVDIIEEGITGVLIPAEDPENMAAAAVKIYRDPALAARLAQNAYQKVKEKYTVERMVDATVRVYTEALESKRILITKLSSLGDIILSTAAIKAIREKFPARYKISFLVGDESKDPLLQCPYIDELIVCDVKNKDKGLGGFLKLSAALRRKDFDICVDLQNNRISHLLSFFSAIPQRYGYDNKKFGFLLTNRIKDDKAPLGPVAHQFRMLRMLGIDLNGYHLELWPGREEEAYIDEFLGAEWMNANQKLVGLNISASARWNTKQLPLEHIIALCDALAQRALRVVITGAENDAVTAHKLMQTVKSTKPINACGKTTVNQLACLIKRCSVYISADSAPLHVAAGMGVPFVALFGATDPRRHLPPAEKFVLIKKDMECSPCYKSSCSHKKCMVSITANEIVEAVEKLLQREAPETAEDGK